MISDLDTEISVFLRFSFGFLGALPLFWGLSIDLLASLECFAFDLGPSDPDFARRGSPQDALGIVFGGRNGVIWKISGECTGFVASIAFAYDFRVFSQQVFRSSERSVFDHVAIVLAFDGSRSRSLKSL